MLHCNIISLIHSLANKLKHVETLVIRNYYMGHATFLAGKDMSYINDVYNIIESKQD